MVSSFVVKRNYGFVNNKCLRFEDPDEIIINMDQRIKPIYLTQKLLITKLNLMKRMNFTFFLLFGLLTFVSSQLSAQSNVPSSSCIDEVNIAVDANCSWYIDESVLGATGPASMAGYINYAGTGSGTAFPGTGSLESLFGSNRPGSVQYELFDQKGGQMLCWGTLNFEIKNTPEPHYENTTLMCGQLGGHIAYLKKYHSPARVLAYNTGACAVALGGVYENITQTQDKCQGNTWTREIWATGSVDGLSRKFLLRRDHVVEMPIDLKDVICPLANLTYAPAGSHAPSVFGSYPNEGNVVYMPCDEETTPENIAKLLGPEYAYPHLDKSDTTEVITPVTVTLIKDSLAFDKKVLIGGYWVTLDTVTVHYDVDSTYNDTTDMINKVIVPIKKGTQCNLSTKCTPWYFPGCYGEDSKEMRVWDMIDWCYGTSSTCVQWIIKVDAKKGLHVIKPIKDQYAPIAPWVCSATVALPGLQVWEGCSEAGPTTYTSTAGVIKDGVMYGIWLADCPIEVWATRTDKCGASVSSHFYVYATDITPPVAVAHDEINVSLTGDPTYAVSPDGGVAKVYKESIDAGSHDAGCGEVNTCVLLREELENPIYVGGKHVYYDGHYLYHPAQCVIDGYYVYYVKDGKGSKKITLPYVICKDFVKFCCSDLGKDNDVALVVSDYAGSYCTKDGTYPNTAYSWTTVNVEDKSGAAWACYEDYTSCVYTDDFEPYKPSYGGVICNQFDIREISREEDVVCGYGGIWVTWGAYDGEELLSTTQCHYKVIPAAPFDPYEIKWPKHYDGTVYGGYVRECEDVKVGKKYYRGIKEYYDDVYMGDTQACVAGADTGAPVWCNTSCGLIGSSYKVDTVSASDACYKLIKRWTIIDWCTWVPNSDGYGDDTNDSYVDEFQAVDDEWLRVNEGLDDAYTSQRGGSGKLDAYGQKLYDGLYNRKDGYKAADGTHVPYPACKECEKVSGDVDDVYFRYSYVYEDGYYTYDQVIKIVDDVEPEILAEDSVIEITDGNASKLPSDYDSEEDDAFADCEASAGIPATASDMCGEIDLTAVGASWWIERTLYDYNGDAVSSKTKADTGESTVMGTGYGRPGWYSIITWRVKDGCGNEGYHQTRHDFVDAKNPTPVCIQDISTAPMNTDSTSTIWASDYDLGSFDNCSEVEVYFKDADGNKTASLTLTCDDFTGGRYETALYVSDDYGNEDFCFVTLNIDPNGICGGGDAEAAAISGEIATATGDMVESATVTTNVGAKDLTNVDGKYAFNSAVNNQYRVRASKSDDYMNGVSTLDLVLIQKHVLGLATLDTPYKIIAADINSDEKVSAIDLVELRKLILGIYTELPSNDSWRFVDATASFDEPTNPFPFAEQLSIDLGTSAISDQNFIAAKVGDVSGNAIANSLIASQGRSTGTIALQIADAAVKSGEIVNVAVSADAFNNIAAYQFTMNVEGLEFVSVTPGAVDMTDESVAVLDENTITAAWFTPSAVSTSETLFTMTFRATTNTTLSSSIALNSSVTTAEAYTAGAEKLELGLAFDYNVVSSFTLFQNEPNPFGDVTRIGFELPEAGTATLTVFDVTGKTVTTQTQEASKGVNFFELRKAELNATGVMYYQLESGENTATKKMIVIE